MASLNNIEKLIQMATIEHMYDMLQKLKNDISFNEVKNNLSCNEVINNIFDESLKKNDSTIVENELFCDEFSSPQNTYSEVINKNVSSDIELLTITIEGLVNKVITLENEINELKQITAH